MRKLPLYPFEWVALGAAILTAVVLFCFGLPIGGDSFVQTLMTVAQLPVPFVLGVLLFGYFHYAQGSELKPYLRQVLSPSWLLLWLRLWIACCLVSFCYFWIKVYVPLMNGGSWDEVLWKIDRWIHLGYSPNELSVNLLGGTKLANWLDRWYAWWLATVIWFLAFYTANTDSLLRRRVVLSSLLLWISGAAIYAIFPVQGPIFAFDETWANHQGSLPRAEEMQHVLGENYEAVLAFGQGKNASFDNRLGIAALPSLHVAFHFIFALWAWRSSRLLAIPFLFMALLTFVGSVLTGWHYAVDGYLGVALAYGCYRLAIGLDQEEAEA